jgi:Mn2+/Fe2+ NRAMP family transporter
MGVLVNSRPTMFLAGLVAVLVVTLNIYLLYRTFSGK